MTAGPCCDRAAIVSPDSAKVVAHTTVIVDARTGYVLSSKQFVGLRGKAGWLRESLEHKGNSKP